MDKKLNFIIREEIKEVRAKEGQTLLQVAERAHLPVPHSCGGMGTCGTCRLIVREGLELLPEPNFVEAEMIHDRGFAPEERLACQNEAIAGLVVEVPHQGSKFGSKFD